LEEFIAYFVGRWFESALTDSFLDSHLLDIHLIHLIINFDHHLYHLYPITSHKFQFSINKNRSRSAINQSFKSISAESNQTNASRLKLLELREELLEKAFDIARADLAASTNDKKKYAILLQGLILQVR
jgi:hypothetical protein